MKSLIKIFPFFNLLLIAALWGLTSCDEYDLSGSEFIEDETYSGLPIYSEWGYNTFGAYYDRLPFISDDGVVFKLICRNDTTSMLFIGEKAGSNSSYYNYYSDYVPMKMTLSFPDMKLTSETDLLVLNDTVVDLVDLDCEVKLTIDNTVYTTSLIEGTVEFKRSQKLYVDDSFAEMILSGYFNIMLFVNDEPVSITNGRFDFGIDNSNFFYIE